MNRFQKLVTIFHRETGQDDTLDTKEARLLRAKLIMEEAVETVAALGFHANGYIEPPKSAGTPAIYNELLEVWESNPNYFEVEFEKEYEELNLLDFIDGLCDLTYVVMGGAVNANVNLERHFEEVHRANMQKLSGPKRSDGKQLKPEGWKGPDHQRIIDLYRQADDNEDDWSEAETRHERLLWGS